MYLTPFVIHLNKLRPKANFIYDKIKKAKKFNNNMEMLYYEFATYTLLSMIIIVFAY